MSALLALAVACTPKAGLPPRPPAHTGVGTADTSAELAHTAAPTGTTGTTGTTGHTGGTQVPSWAGLQPRTIVLGDADHPLGADGVFDLGDSDNDGFNEFAVNQLPDDPMYQPADGVVISAPIPSGVHALAELEVGQVPGMSPDDASKAGDANADGYSDVWLGNYLYMGPFVGRELEGLDYAMTVTGNILGRLPIGGFDADEDGFVDVAFPSRYESFDIFYGPFTEDLAGPGTPGYDPTQTTRLLAGRSCEVGSVLLGAVNEPGQLVLTAGWGYPEEQHCAPVQLYDIRGPRGRILQRSEAIATFPSSINNAFQALPDANGDGLTDVLYVYQPVTAPITGEYPAFPDYGREEPPIMQLRFEGEFYAYAIPDVSGDGLGDLVVRLDHRHEEYPNAYFVVPGTVRGWDPPLDIADHGVLLGIEPAAVDTFLAVDLDRDGPNELIVSDPDWNTHGMVMVFSGSEIAAALAALPPPPPHPVP